MLHLSLVQNLLSAIGAAPHLSRPNFPQPASHYPAGVHLALVPFGEEALRHFMFLERPEGMDVEDAAGIAAIEQAAPAAVPSMQHGEIVPRLQEFDTVGHLYRSIEAGVARLAEKYGEQRLFVGPPRAQATEPHFRWPELVAVTDVASAQRAIDAILEQGEGARGQWRNAHFGQFVAILDEYLELREANPAFEPVRPVVTLNVRPAERQTDIPLAGDPVTRRVMDLLNVSNEILLLMLPRFFAHTDETDRSSGARRRRRSGSCSARSSRSATVDDAPGGPGVPRPSRRAPASSCSTSPTTCCRTARRPGSCSPSASARPPNSASRAAPATPRVTDGLRAVRSSLAGIAGRPRRPPAASLRPANPGSGRGPRRPAGPRRRFLPNGAGLCLPRRPRAFRRSRHAGLGLPGSAGRLR